MGKLGKKATMENKAEIVYKLFRKSVILLIPFVFVVLTLKD
jgi:hypothetical protein